METSPIQSLIQVNQEDIASQRKIANLDEDKINEGIDAIQEWIKKEDHLVETIDYLNRDIIERLFVLSQGSLENCKKLVDRILTTRALLSDIALNRTYEEFEQFLDNIIVLPLPKCNPIDRTRIFVIGITNENYQDLDFITGVRLAFLAGDFRMKFDYIYADRYLVDLKYFKANMLVKINPIVLKKAEILVTKTYGLKLKGIHFVNAPSYVDKVILLLRQVLKEKLAQRIHVHKSYDELHQHIDKDILPTDFGGNAVSCKNLAGQWREYLKTDEAKSILDNANKLFSNESKRSNVQFNEEYLGMPGSFKRLNVD